jgi:hypothetical protein
MSGRKEEPNIEKLHYGKEENKKEMKKMIIYYKTKDTGMSYSLLGDKIKLLP